MGERTIDVVSSSTASGALAAPAVTPVESSRACSSSLTRSAMSGSDVPVNACGERSSSIFTSPSS